jgi:hypothetical protein
MNTDKKKEKRRQKKQRKRRKETNLVELHMKKQLEGDHNVRFLLSLLGMRRKGKQEGQKCKRSVLKEKKEE